MHNIDRNQETPKKIENIAAAIEADAGEGIPGLHESFAEMERDERERTHTPEQIALRDEMMKQIYPDDIYALKFPRS